MTRNKNAMISSAEFVAIYEKFLAVKKILAKHFTKSHFYRVGLSFDNADYVLSSDDYSVMEAVDGLSVNFSVSKFVYDESKEIKMRVTDNVFNSHFFYYEDENQRKMCYDEFMKRIDAFIEKVEKM